MIKRRKIIKQLTDVAIEIAKKRDNYTCQKCGKVVSGSNCHGSHVIPVSAGIKLRWNTDNILTLCMHCHLFWWHKNPLEAAEWFKEKFPRRNRYLMKNRGVVKIASCDLEQQLQELCARLEVGK